MAKKKKEELENEVEGEAQEAQAVEQEQAEEPQEEPVKPEKVKKQRVKKEKPQKAEQVEGEQAGEQEPEAAAPIKLTREEKQIVKERIKQKMRNKAQENGIPVTIHVTLSLILCFAMIPIMLVNFLTPIISGSGFSITPYQLMTSLSIEEITMTGVPPLYVSYYINKYFFYFYAVMMCAILFFTMMILLARGKKVHKHANVLMYVSLFLLLLSMLLGFNYVNVIHAYDQSVNASTFSYIYFALGLIVLLAKFFADVIFCKYTMNEDLKDSSSQVYTSFTQSFLALLSMIFPLYILPGTPYRMRGIDILLNSRPDVFSTLPMAPAYKFILLGFAGIVGASLILNMFFFLISRKLFVRFNRFNHLFSLFSLIVYAFMGINYLLCYIDAAMYVNVFALSLNTYSYVPIALLFLFWLGVGFTKIATSKANVVYKIFATPEEENELEKALQEKALAAGGAKPSGDSSGVPEGETKSESTVADPVPAFSELDKRLPFYESEYQKRLGYSFLDLTLPELVKHVIEYAKYSRERLSYGPVEVKTFIAGLAASRLSILQGMSGTGKTSLPKIFMESIDGFCEIVAIESSWRDKNELLGYYNEFNKKYTPKTFTQYLYKASLNKEIPTFIVLDEMNLSRIEYYFSDFLSLMEARENLRNIKLYDVQLFPHIDERENYLALRDGHTIDIPTNVWFIGTANRDESTFEISDKVYDRAQTMNFDKRAPKVVLTEEKVIPKKFVPYSALRKLFDESKSIAFDAEKYDAIQKIEKILKPYKISFGNRVLKQIEEFVNAYLACSEINSPADKAKYTHEAVDCIVFSKVVRKLELKQITDIDGLIEDFEALKMAKSIEFLHTLRETV